LLAVTIKRTLDALKVKPQDIDYFACGLGPGSFTGVRVGLATIKGLAWSLNKPVIGISSLDVLAKNVTQNEGFVAPIIDAKRNLIYTSIYKAGDGTQKRITPYMLLSIEEFLKRIKNKTIILGDAVSLYQEKISRHLKGVAILDKDYWLLQPRHIIDLALERIKEKKFNNPFEIKPIYLYPKECQIKNQKAKPKD
jgi:tRNA threonylcarbamoyladenosine biosynthesis protein TsaB